MAAHYSSFLGKEYLRGSHDFDVPVFKRLPPFLTDAANTYTVATEKNNHREYYCTVLQ